MVNKNSNKGTKVEGGEAMRWILILGLLLSSATSFGATINVTLTGTPDVFSDPTDQLGANESISEVLSIMFVFDAPSFTGIGEERISPTPQSASLTFGSVVLDENDFNAASFQSTDGVTFFDGVFEKFEYSNASDLGVIGVALSLLFEEGSDEIFSLGLFSDDNVFVEGTLEAVVTVTQVPVPAAVWLFISALGGLGGIRKLRRNMTTGSSMLRAR